MKDDKNLIGIIDYGGSNLKSVFNAFNKLNIVCEICDDYSKLDKYDKLILPGVGAFELASKQLKANGFFNKIIDKVNSGTPILGICLGMQLLLNSSEEYGYSKGMGLIDGEVKSFKNIGVNPHIHMGWNDIKITNNSNILGEGNETYYFVHGYYCDIKEQEFVAAKVHHGLSFDVAYERNNIFAVQFHPEKSQKNGLSLLKKFANL
ncbi:hypothetical protein M947_11105 [Sulfurimonas hongkongensis]|uniref:Imidazole glycerol phosphate synthase subunit HisH n=1 Tax=Sulfurimonas hongkongensis TaxID=1172190 RepID=T0JC49_9BACT|nr:imidazole glycerol phosphate synthase subunit HisH [Sulfurimonas hongkongensis]EQB34422.1 hypothetical protein M947_11105 [Sulfurimonas hongkongensis]